MYRTAFPELHHLKEAISRPGARWPTVVLNVEASDIHRPDIRGPLVLFMNLAGESIVGVDGRSTRIPEGQYLITNRGQEFTLSVEPRSRATTFNVHVSDEVSERLEHALVTPSSTLLDAPHDATDGEARFVNRLYRRDDRLDRIVETMRASHRDGLLAPMAIEEHVCDLVALLCDVHRNLRGEIARLPAMRHATRQEVHVRLSRALDMLESGLAGDLSLELLAREACLSKFHFLRLFKAAFGETPHQYLLRRRVERAQELLRRTSLPVAEIGMAVGFDEPSVFSRVFRQRAGVPPGRFRVSQ